VLNDPLADGPEIKLPARFEVLRLEDAGAHGVVWLVFDRDLQRIVALKTLRVPDLSKFSRLKREFRALMDIRHPNLVELYELFSEGDAVCFTMELVEGKSLTTWFTSAAGSPMARLELALRQLVAAIQTLHQNDRLHRDIKPSNILVTPEGRLVLLDFGLTTVLDALDGDSLAGRPAGTRPRYPPTGGASSTWSA
jgi:serine/threonine protein kinase